jgi:hypothetical protein
LAERADLAVMTKRAYMPKVSKINITRRFKKVIGLKITKMACPDLQIGKISFILHFNMQSKPLNAALTKVLNKPNRLF